MNDSLKFYKNNIKVGSICGNLPFLKKIYQILFFYIIKIVGVGQLGKDRGNYILIIVLSLKKINQKKLKKNLIWITIMNFQNI